MFCVTQVRKGVHVFSFMFSFSICFIKCLLVFYRLIYLHYDIAGGEGHTEKWQTGLK